MNGFRRLHLRLLLWSSFGEPKRNVTSTLILLYQRIRKLLFLSGLTVGRVLGHSQEGLLVFGELLGGNQLRLFISFEGVEGSGKTTQVEMLHSFLVDMRVSVVKTREPGGTALGDRLRPLLLEPSDAPFSPLAELFLYVAARAQLVKEVIAPALDHHTVVISDRYVDSTIAYQGYARGIDMSLIERLNQSATNGCLPDLTVLLDMDPEVGLNRISSRPLSLHGAGKDRLEGESLHFHRQVRKGYLLLADRNPDRFFVVNGRSRKEEIHKLVKHELIRRYPDSFPTQVPTKSTV